MSGVGRLAGGAASGVDQVSRRTANTDVALAAISPPWVSSIDQCWVKRLVRNGRAVMTNSPSTSAAAKLTVRATGSASRAVCCIGACSRQAAVTPPNGPTMLAWAGLVWPRKLPSGSTSSRVAVSKGRMAVVVGEDHSVTMTPKITGLTPGGDSRLSRSHERLERELDGRYVGALMTANDIE